MNQIAQHLDNESDKALALLVGCRLQTLMSESSDIQVGSTLIEVLSVSMQLDKRCFIVIESDWDETPQEWMNFHRLSVRISESPKNIRYDTAPSGTGGNYYFDHFSLHFGAESPVATIEVLEATVEGERESVTYDAGLLITRQDGMKAAIVRVDSILGSLQIAHTAADIAAVTEGLVARYRYGHAS